MADEAQAKSMPAIVLPHWEPSLASVTGETVREIRRTLIAVSRGAEK